MPYDNGILEIVRKINFHAQALQRLPHIAGIIAFKQIFKVRRTFGKRRNQKNAIRDAL